MKERSKDECSKNIRMKGEWMMHGWMNESRKNEWMVGWKACIQQWVRE